MLRIRRENVNAAISFMEKAIVKFGKDGRRLEFIFNEKLAEVLNN